MCLADKEQQEVPDCGEQRELLVVRTWGGESGRYTEKSFFALMLGQYNDILAFSVTVIKCMTDHIMDAIPMCTFYIRSHSHFLPRGGAGLILISPLN